MCKILSPHLMTATLSSVIYTLCTLYTLCIARARLESVYDNKSSEGEDMPSNTPSPSTLPIAWVAFKDISWLKTGDLGLFTHLIPFRLTSQWTIYSALSLSFRCFFPGDSVAFANPYRHVYSRHLYLRFSLRYTSVWLHKKGKNCFSMVAYHLTIK